MPKRIKKGIAVVALLVLCGCTNQPQQSAESRMDSMPQSQNQEIASQSQTVENQVSSDGMPSGQASSVSVPSEQVSSSPAPSEQVSSSPVPPNQAPDLSSETAGRNIIDSENIIGESRAMELALERAGVSEDVIMLKDVELDRENNRLEYEIEFEVNNIEYDISVDAYTGEIIEFFHEYD